MREATKRNVVSRHLGPCGLVLAQVALLAGALDCAGAKPVADAPETTSLQPLTIVEQTLTDVTVEARLQFDNPDQTPLEIKEATYEVTLDGTSMGKGHVALDYSVEGGGSQFVRIPAPTTLATDEESLNKWVAKGDQPIHVVMQGTLHITEQGTTRDVPFAEVCDMRAPRFPLPKMNDVDVGRYGEGGELGVNFFVGVENQNAFEVRVKSISYHASLDGQELAAGMASTGDRLPPSQTAEYEIVAETKKPEKDEMSYGLEGIIDLGIAKVPIHLSGKVNFSKPSQHKKKPSQD